jgi:hypothetical protein
MAACNDNRDAAAHVRETYVEKRVALVVRKQELFRVVGEDTNAVDALIDHAIEHTTLSVDVKLAGYREWRRCNRKRPRERSGKVHAFSWRLFNAM